MAERQKLAYLGIGIMGSRMARRLLDAGYEVAVWNRSAGKSEALVAAGARAVTSPAEAADFADVVFACVTDAYSVRQVVFGENGLASVDGAGKVFVDHSSIRPDACREMAADLREASGWGWIDAPVSGGVAGAESGKLTVMAGGSEADFAHAEPIVAHLAQRFSLMGTNGAGQATKLINQVLVGCAVAVLSEAAALAMRAGIDAARIPEALAGGRADSLLLQQFFPKMVSGDFFVEAHIRTMLKDLDTVLVLARETTTAMPMTAIALELHRLMVQRGHGDKDGTALATLYLNSPV